MATTHKSKAAGPSTRGLKVTARAPSFRRAGHMFGAEAKTIALSELTDEQVELLTSEPMLVVQEVDIDPTKEEAKK